VPITNLDLPTDPLEFVRLALAGKLTIVDLLDNLPIYDAGASWLPWRSFLCSLYGLPMTPDEQRIYTECTGRKIPPTKKAREAWIIAGRRARKSAISALIIVWESALRDHRLSKAPFERARALIMSETLTRGRQVFNYARAILEHTALRCLLQGEANTERIPLWNEVDIELAPCRAMEGRSRTTVIAAFDEIAFFQTDDEYANPDSVIYESVRPSMMLVQQPLVLAFSSPYSRKGLLWANYQKHYGREDSDILVWQADSLFMHPHPMVKQEMERAYLDDPASAAAEFGAQFRTDIEEFVSLDLLRTITSKRGVLEIERDAEGERLYPKRPYYAFVDPSGGGADQFTLAISSYDSDSQRAILNGVWAWNPPFNVESVTEAVAVVLKRFSITQVKGDHYGGRYPRDLFSRHGITYTPSDLDRSSIYLEVLPLLRSGRVDLPESLKGCEFNLVDGVPHATKVDVAHRMRQQFTQLERKVTGKGKEIVDHPRGKHDDVVNSACGAILMAGVRGKRVIQKVEAAAAWTPAQRWRDMTKPGQYVTPARAASNPYARRSGSPSPLGPTGSRKVY